MKAELKAAATASGSHLFDTGVTTLGYLATNSKGQTVVVVAMLSEPARALSPSVVIGLQAIVQGAFHLVR